MDACTGCIARTSDDSSTGGLMQWTQALQERTAQTTQAWRQAIQESTAGKAIQESTTRVCCVCEQRVLRTAASACPECKLPCCQGCVAKVFQFNPTGGSSIPIPGVAQPYQLQVCQKCKPTVQARVREENVRERMKRAQAFLDGHLAPYKYNVESKIDQSFRIGGNVLYGVKQVASCIPLAAEVSMAISASYYVVRYGPLVLVGNDVIMAFQLIVGLAKKLDIPALIRSAPEDLFGGLYYIMGEFCGERGKTPELESLEHVDEQGRTPAPSRELLLELRRLVRLLCSDTYAETPVDTQRLLRQMLPGSELVLAEVSSSPELLTYYLVCTRQDRKAYLILPGTAKVQDIVTDFKAEGDNFLHGVAHKGMAEVAHWLLGEVSPILVHLYTKGYTVVVVGHSLGAGIGGLFTMLLRSKISNLFCYGFGTPACIDENLIGLTLDCMVSVVNHDDIVPRLTVHNVQGLVDSVLCPGQIAKTKAWMAEDWTAIKDVERVVELRRREAPAAEGYEVSDEKIKYLCDAGVARPVAERALQIESGDLTRALLRATEEEHSSQDLRLAPTAVPVAAASGAAPASTLAGASQNFFDGLHEWGTATGARFREMVSTAVADNQRRAVVSSTGSQLSLLEQHPRFFVPGQVVHIYKKDGLGRAALASCTHDTFARIHPSQQMVEDHLLTSYDVAIQQACILTPQVPQWESFDRRATCACCNSDFNWAYVLQSEPQKLLGRHHCRACGRVVCDGCSQHKRAHPQLGFVDPVRTCDGCFFNCRADL